MTQAVIKTRVIGIDVSIDVTTCAIVDIRGRIVAKDEIPTREHPTISTFVNELCEKVVTLAEANGGYDTIRSVGLSVPSGNNLTGCIENAPNLPWKGVIPLAAMLRDRLGLAVALGNDAHCIALGEYVFGSAHGLRDFLVVTIGHGLGSYSCVNKRFVLGSHGFGGELGHTCVVDNGRQCECGLKGCLETYVAEKGIVRTAMEMLEASDEPSLMRNCDVITPRIVKKCCDEGDKMAIEVFRKAGYLLGISLANYAATFDPEAIIISGGISKAGHWLLDPVEESFNLHLFNNIRGKVKILLSALDNRERDVLGASALAWEVKEYSLFK